MKRKVESSGRWSSYVDLSGWFLGDFRSSVSSKSMGKGLVVDLGQSCLSQRLRDSTHPGENVWHWCKKWEERRKKASLKCWKTAGKSNRLTSR